MQIAWTVQRRDVWRNRRLLGCRHRTVYQRLYITQGYCSSNSQHPDANSHYHENRQSWRETNSIAELLQARLLSQLDFGPLRGVAGEIDQAIDGVVGDFSVILCVTRCFEIAWCP
jgi:hypothetical protein